MSSRAAYIDLPRVSQLPEVDIDEHEVQPQAESIAREFVAAFDAACSRQDHSAFDELFIEEQGWWRDIIAFSALRGLPAPSHARSRPCSQRLQVHPLAQHPPGRQGPSCGRQR